MPAIRSAQKIVLTVSQMPSFFLPAALSAMMSSPVLSWHGGRVRLR